MAFEAGCGSSTVLTAIRVATSPRFLVPGEFWEALRDSATPTLGSRWRMRVEGGKSEIRNSAAVRHRARLGHGAAQRAKPEGRE